MKCSRAFAAMIFLVLAFSKELQADQSNDRQQTFKKSIELFDMAQSPAEFRESAKVLESILADGFATALSITI